MKLTIKTLLFLAPFFYWLFCAWPWVFYSFDLDATDGDFLNAVLRLRSGLPLYGDWTQGEIYGNYGPLYYLWASFFSYFLSLEELVYSLRLSNLFFLLLSFAFFSLSFKKLLKDKQQLFPALLLFSVSFWVLMGESTIGALALRSDAMLLAFQSMAFFWVTRYPKKTVWAVLIAASLPLVKQSGLAASLALFLLVLRANHGRRVKLVLLTALFAAGLVAALEFLSAGHYLNSNFFHPREVFSTPGNAVEGYDQQLMREFFRGQMWIHHLTLLALVGATVFSQRLRGLVLFLLFELLLFRKIGENIGGGLSYLWFYGQLLSAGIALLSTGMLFSKSLLSRLLLKRAVFPLFFLAFSYLAFSASRIMWRSQEKRAIDAQLAFPEQERLFETELKDFLVARADSNWFSARYSMPLIKSDILLDVESCTLQFALHKKSFVDEDKIWERFAQGHYEYVWASDLRWMPEIYELVKKCYELDREFQWFFRAKPQKALVYRFKGCEE